LLLDQLPLFHWLFMVDFYTMLVYNLAVWFLWLNLKFSQDFWLVLCYHIFSLPLLLDLLALPLKVWLTKFVAKLNKIQESFKEQLNQITKLALIFQPKQHCMKWLPLVYW
jgi:hypothetical protein